MNWDEMSARERDALVAEKVMGIDLKPLRDVAMVKVGYKHILSTGRVFHITRADGSTFELPMPEGKHLPQPNGTTNWNDRYAHYVASFFENEYADEIEEVRDEPKPFTTDISEAWEVAEKEKITVHPGYHSWSAGYCNASGTTGDTEWVGMTNRKRWSYAPTAPEAICIAALRAVGVEV